MKKLVLTAAVVACAGVVSAQVYSENIVGYNKDAASAAGFHISAMQFENATNTPTTVYGSQMPVGSKIYKFNGTSYDTSTYGSVFVPIQGLVTKWSAELNLAGGAGYWVEVPSAAEAVLAGEVPAAASITNQLSAGFSLVSYPYPVDRVVTNMDLSPAVGDKIYVFNGTSYDTSTYGSVFVPIQGLVTKWSNETLAIGVGEGFWYETTSAQAWVVNKPF